MHEINLIPADYKEREKYQHYCVVFLCLMIALGILIVSLKLGVQHKTKQLQAQIEVLENGKNFKLEQQQKFNDLLAQERLLNERLRVLNSLRSGVTVKQLMLAVDRVLDGEVWFTDWSLIRMPVVQETSPAQQVIAKSEPALQMTTSMEITGQALDHSKLATFVSQLIKQPEIKDVKLINTSIKAYQTEQVVDFKMVIIVNNQSQDSHV